MGCSEQLIPMFGLSALEHVVQPKSTLEKLWFLLEHAFTRAHELTTLISFGALGVLVGFRAFKQAFKRYWFIYRLPEVFIVVVASTSASVLSVLARFRSTRCGVYELMLTDVVVLNWVRVVCSVVGRVGMGQGRSRDPRVRAHQHRHRLPHPVPAAARHAEVPPEDDLDRSVRRAASFSSVLSNEPSSRIADPTRPACGTCGGRLISVVGFLDSIVAAKQNAGRFGYSISPNRELVALGAGNIVGAFIPGTLPAYGSITR